MLATGGWTARWSLSNRSGTADASVGNECQHRIYQLDHVWVRKGVFHHVAHAMQLYELNLICVLLCFLNSTSGTTKYFNSVLNLAQMIGDVMR